MKMNAPIKLEMKVYAVNKDGQQAIVTMSLLLVSTLRVQRLKRYLRMLKATCQMIFA